jgi:hypothetical protein
MISHRSAWLALAAVSVLSSCFSSRSGEHHSPAVKDSSSYTTSHSSRVSAPLAEPEYFEGASAPEAPAAVAEERPSAPSPAHVWVAGQHTRQKGKWVWSSGRYALPPSADLVWVPGHWVAHLRGYVWIDGAWR